MLEKLNSIWQDFKYNPPKIKGYKYNAPEPINVAVLIKCGDLLDFQMRVGICQFGLFLEDDNKCRIYDVVHDLTDVVVYWIDLDKYFAENGIFK